MSKKKAIAIMIVLVIISSGLTFTISNMLALQVGNKVIIPKAEYSELTSMYNDFSKIIGVEEYIKENYLRDVDDSKVLDGQLKGLVQSLEDPYSQYLTAEEYASFTEQSSGIYGGIGVMVTPGEDNYITVVSPIEDTPGERAGLKTGDKILKVNGEEFFADSMDKAVKVMKGTPNTAVTLTIGRKDKEGKNEIFDVEIIREEIRLVTVKSDIIADNIGYIKLTSFDELTYEDFKANLNGLEADGVKGLIIDLRNNPGGLLNITANIADEFLGVADIVYTETKD
ncbi:MAG: PDZ domain-containing protein, partial [Tissierellia bacterium]|nr:PDZ domain-containing protein [Tissierellia bacterium]